MISFNFVSVTCFPCISWLLVVFIIIVIRLTVINEEFPHRLWCKHLDSRACNFLGCEVALQDGQASEVKDGDEEC